ncbi:hypothetical protein CLV51_102743 [Chitinophaga niastensis]|uniref:Uncharacterized protein n=1 Tax=Chitinophaga niastensis TaxID=536980 RepID=A0A2P8HNU1_CHINA|nr:hypothetical protein [Chitinophaga niastensis]PSL47883.1 hypothetical protein CLV51_102743 [Chitinophaga niastensis]
MELIRILASKNEGSLDGLYSIQFKGESQCEYDKLLEKWRNRLELFSFFKENISDLQNGFWGNITIEEAMSITAVDVDTFEEILRIHSQGGRYELQYIFQPLYNHEYRLTSLQKSKGKIKRSWLRLYALRLDGNCFVITGGAIKLTNDMRAAHLQAELKKMDHIRAFLHAKDIYIPDDLNSL